MGFNGRLALQKKARRLRKGGLSYREIQKWVPVAKSTLSRWCRDIVLSPTQLERLRQKKLSGAQRGRIIGARKLQIKRILETKKIIEEAKEEVGFLSKRDRFIAGIALYLGDGLKGDREVGFSNSDPRIIKFMMSWFREFCLIPEDKFRGQIWIHDNLDELKAREFWSKLTGVPLKQFRKSYIAKNKLKSRKIRKNIHEHGVFAIKVSSVRIQRRIIGWMNALLEGAML